MSGTITRFPRSARSMSLRISGVRATVLALAALFATSAGAASKCDRACLEKTLDQYLNAVLKHDPASAPLDVTFRYTENAIVMKAGEGLWKSASALGKIQRRYFDPVNESAAYFGHIEEGARLRSQNHGNRHRLRILRGGSQNHRRLSWVLGRPATRECWRRRPDGASSSAVALRRRKSKTAKGPFRNAKRDGGSSEQLFRRFAKPRWVACAGTGKGCVRVEKSE